MAAEPSTLTPARAVPQLQRQANPNCNKHNSLHRVPGCPELCPVPASEASGLLAGLGLNPFPLFLFLLDPSLQYTGTLFPSGLLALVARTSYPGSALAWSISTSVGLLVPKPTISLVQVYSSPHAPCTWLLMGHQLDL